MRRDLIVPKGKCPLDVLAEQGEKIRNTWIFLHESVVSNLESSDGVARSCIFRDSICLTWTATEKHSAHIIAYHNFETTDWFILENVWAENIAYDVVRSVDEPKEVIFVKMEGAE